MAYTLSAVVHLRLSHRPQDGHEDIRQHQLLTDTHVQMLSARAIRGCLLFQGGYTVAADCQRDLQAEPDLEIYILRQGLSASA
jgi:hypothetical protein